MAEFGVGLLAVDRFGRGFCHVAWAEVLDRAVAHVREQARERGELAWSSEFADQAELEFRARAIAQMSVSEYGGFRRSVLGISVA